MISAFGVEHGEITKAFKAIRPKLGRAIAYDRALKEHDTMGSKLRRHAVQARMTSGAIGHRLARWSPEKRAAYLSSPGGNKWGSQKPMTQLEGRQEAKRAAQGMYDALGRNSRKTRSLP